MPKLIEKKNVSPAKKDQTTDPIDEKSLTPKEEGYKAKINRKFAAMPPKQKK
jgi:hypothetical protein